METFIENWKEKQTAILNTIEELKLIESFWGVLGYL